MFYFYMIYIQLAVYINATMLYPRLRRGAKKNPHFFIFSGVFIMLVIIALILFAILYVIAPDFVNGLFALAGILIVAALGLAALGGLAYLAYENPDVAITIGALFFFFVVFAVIQDWFDKRAAKKPAKTEIETSSSDGFSDEIIQAAKDGFKPEYLTDAEKAKTAKQLKAALAISTAYFTK